MICAALVHLSNAMQVRTSRLYTYLACMLVLLMGAAHRGWARAGEEPVWSDGPLRRLAPLVYVFAGGPRSIGEQASDFPADSIRRACGHPRERAMVDEISDIRAVKARAVGYRLRR